MTDRAAILDIIRQHASDATDMDALADALVEHLDGPVEKQADQMIAEIKTLATVQACGVYKREVAEMISHWPTKQQLRVSAALEERQRRVGLR
jgi:hypothetical protein